MRHLQPGALCCQHCYRVSQGQQSHCSMLFVGQALLDRDYNDLTCWCTQQLYSFLCSTAGLEPHVSESKGVDTKAAVVPCPAHRPVGSLALFFAADPRRSRSAYNLLPDNDISSLLEAPSAAGEQQQQAADGETCPATTLLYRPHHVAVAVDAKGEVCQTNTTPPCIGRSCLSKV